MLLFTYAHELWLGAVRITRFDLLSFVALLGFSYSASSGAAETYEEQQNAQANHFEAQCLGLEPRVDPLLCLAEHGFACASDHKTEGEIVWRCILEADRGRFVARIFYESETVRYWVSWKPDK